MYKTLLITFLITGIFTNLFAQKQHNIWYFGDHAGIDFNSGSAVAITNNGMYTDEGTSVICDSAGNLLFYSEGVLAYDRTQNYMANSVILDGNESTDQAALIVPLPGSDTLYYLFTQDNNVGANGFRYSIVDMALNGGLGDVTSTKNVPLSYPSCEKLCGIKAANDTDAWIIVHEYASNTFESRLLQSSGLSAPVFSNVGSNYVGNDYDGQIKGNSQGTKLAAALYGSNVFELYDFNNATGVLSNPIKINSGAPIEPHGVEFSPNGKYLYGTTEPYRYLYQWDISSGVAATINASVIVLAIDTVGAFGDLQLAPDGRIYLTNVGRGYLGVINNPDMKGVACAYVDSGFYLAGKDNIYGLPNYIKDNLQAVSPPVASFSSVNDTVCAGACKSFNNSSSNATSYQWSFPGATPSTSSAANPSTVCYTSAGNYSVTLIAYNSGGSDTLTLSNYITVKAAPPTPVIRQSGDTLFCSADSGNVTYQWYADTMLIPNATDTFLIISTGGNYNIKVSNQNGCSTATGTNIILGLEKFTIDDLRFTISPNPAGNQLVVSSKQLAGKKVSIEFYNALGEKIYTLPQSEIVNRKSEILIDVSSLPAGLYFVLIQNENERWTGKFVKE